LTPHPEPPSLPGDRLHLRAVEPGDGRPIMRILLAEPRGFCAGVVRAIEIVERALAIHGAPVYVRHEIVHNRHVVEDLRAKGAVFVRELDEVPQGALTVFSAHGVARLVERDAAARGLDVLDATCPLVTKVHVEGRRYAKDGRSVILIGHAGHPEVEGTLGQIDGEVHLVADVADVAALPIAQDRAVAYVTQTTLSVDDTRAVIEAIRTRFADVVGPGTRDICYATQNRQTAVRDLARECDVVLVVGAANSSNSNRLREIAEECGARAFLIADAGALTSGMVKGATTVGVTAGASAPERLVEEVVATLRALGAGEVAALPGITEDVTFRLPARLQQAAAE
jgi:4-hydroxy-3-methylbut-2-enyl diphosphate reductase